MDGEKTRGRPASGACDRYRVGVVRMIPPCPCCTGSRYLSDNVEFGPCICVTPGNMILLEQERDALLEQECNAERILAPLVERLPDVAAAFADYLANGLGMDANPVTIENQYLAALADEIDRIQLNEDDLESLEDGGNKWSRAARYAVNLNEELGWWVATFRDKAPPERVKEAHNLFTEIQGET